MQYDDKNNRLHPFDSIPGAKPTSIILNMQETTETAANRRKYGIHPSCHKTVKNPAYFT